VLGIVLAVLAILAAVMGLVGAGHGGPARHF
jgi:Na+-transporting methylmalonyl-CoA/oxaloacetate decarboxylase gamma subunit